MTLTTLKTYNKGLQLTQHAVSKLPFPYAAFYGILNTVRYATEAGAMHWQRSSHAHREKNGRHIYMSLQSNNDFVEWWCRA